MSEHLLKKAAELMAAIPEAALAMTDLDGYPTVSMVSSLRTNGLGMLWFTSGASGRKAKRMARCDQASVCYREGWNNITLVGTLELVTDLDMKHVLWSDDFLAHFKGVDDPEYGVFKFSTGRVNLFVDGQSYIGELR